MNDQFTDTARLTLELAQHEALRFNHEFVGTEHVLLGLRRTQSGLANELLAGLGLDVRTLRMRVEQFALPGPNGMPAPPLPWTPRAKRALRHARELASNLSSESIDSHHLLLGLIHDPECLAAQILSSFGIDRAALSVRAGSQA